MQDYKTLKLYAKNRKFAEAIKISMLPEEWILYARDLAVSLPDTNQTALKQREELGITGTEIEDYSNLVKFYSQRYVNSMSLPDQISQFENVHHLRFGILGHKETIPYHLDEPYTLRFIAMIEGAHKYRTETGVSFDMKAGELWFINGSYKHSIENVYHGTRIALLGKFDNSLFNLKILNELL